MPHDPKTPTRQNPEQEEGVEITPPQQTPPLWQEKHKCPSKHGCPSR